MKQRYKNFSVHQPTTRRQTNVYDSPPLSRSSRLYVGLAVVILLFGAVFYINHTVQAGNQKAETAENLKRTKKQAIFKDRVTGIVLANKSIDISVSTIDIKSGEGISIGDTSPMLAGGTASLITAVNYLNQIENGEIAPGSTVEGFKTLEAVRQLINRGDEKIWLELNNQLNSTAAAEYAQRAGADDYDVNKNRISTKSMAALLQKLYSGQLLNSRNTSALLSYMQNTNYENFIPPALDKNIKIHHIAAVVDDTVNDSAVIDDGKNKFILVIFTNGNGAYDWDGRAKIMQKITELAVRAYL